MVHLDYTRRLDGGKGHARGSRFFNTAYDRRRERALRERGWRRERQMQRSWWQREMQMQMEVHVVLVIQSLCTPNIQFT